MKIDGNFVKAYRTKLGLSRAKFGDLVGYSEAHIFKMEKGEREVSEVFKNLIRMMIEKNPSEEG